LAWLGVFHPLVAIYLYCFLRATAEPPPHLLGIDGSPVRVVDLDGLVAWVSDTAGPAVMATPERARQHDGVVRAALERETPLPARFGQVITDETALGDAVSSRRSAFEAALKHVAGAVEMTVRMLMPSQGKSAGGDPMKDVDNPTTTGRDYLERVAAVQRQERNLLAEEGIVRGRVSSAVRGLVRAESFAGAAQGSSMATLSHLVPRENVEAYRSALLVLRDETPALAIMVSGPWAPYSFTEGVRV
jgi:alkylhydroperoxidase/carboxymuconolactone decarboxylase family protein YurZ